MLALLRRIVAIILFGIICTYLLTASASLMASTKWIGQIQLIPAIAAGSLSIVVVTLAVTLLLGRIYCSTLCPMGFWQDVTARLYSLSPRIRRRGGAQYHYRTPSNAIRIATLLTVVAATAAGTSLLTALLDPYANWGRIATYIFRPLIHSGHLLPVTAASALATLIAIIALAGIGAWSARKGRMWCNTLCPVGTALGVAARYSVMKIDINTDKCINCHRCEHACKSRCIDLQSHVIDMTRCVVCFDCLPVCPNDAIHYTHRRHRLSIPMMMPVDAPATTSATSSPSTASCRVSRRRFLLGAAALAATPAILAVEKRLPSSAQADTPHTPVPPPGASSLPTLLSKCVGCGACIGICPQKVIRPALGDWGIIHPLVPVMDFDASYCLYDCNHCTRACPTGALTPLTVEQKQHTPIGLANVAADRCIGCGRCSRACPTHAITMVTDYNHNPRNKHNRVALVDHTMCIGCGHCQNVCPVTPKAIIVSGLRR